MRTTHENLWGPLLVLLIVLFAIFLRAMATANGRAARSPLSHRGVTAEQRAPASLSHTSIFSRAATVNNTSATT
ncbi:hypothetical protein [Aeoliella sp. SH292]|uniref:hypothetical protein n=1 Tax=Aeoliella sp. SH292 TaxID=3454464 RepID=UPI003F9CC6F6